MSENKRVIVAAFGERVADPRMVFIRQEPWPRVRNQIGLFALWTDLRPVVA